MSKTGIRAIFMACALHSTAFAASPPLPHDYSSDQQKSSLTIGTARNLDPSLLPAAGVCSEARLLKSFAQTANTETVLTFSAAAKTLFVRSISSSGGSKSLKSIAEMSNFTLARFAEHLNEFKKADRKLLVSLYRHYNPEADLQFKAWEIPKRIELLKTLASDPFLMSARAKWATLRMPERMDVARYAHKIHAKIYGFPLANVVRVREGSRGTITHAYYSNDNDNKLAINTFRSKSHPEDHTIVYDDFDEFVGVVIHEGDHVFMRDMALRKDIPESLKIMAAVWRFTNQGNNYLSAGIAGLAAYNLNPVEVNANSLENDVWFYLSSKQDDRGIKIEILEDQQETLLGAVETLQRQFSAENKNLSCNVFAP